MQVCAILDLLETWKTLISEDKGLSENVIPNYMLNFWKSWCDNHKRDDYHILYACLTLTFDGLV